jgi:hypothetical protein
MMAEMWSVKARMGDWREKDHDGVVRHTRSMAVGVWLLHDLVVHELLELLLGEAVHQLASLMCRLEVLAVLAYFVDVHLLEVSIAWPVRQAGKQFTTGVSNSYKFFHFVWPGAITSISVYSNGLRSHTFDKTSFASVHREQFWRTNKVIRRLHCWRRMADALILIGGCVARIHVIVIFLEYSIARRRLFHAFLPFDTALLT